MIEPVLGKLFKQNDLTAEEMAATMTAIMQGEVTQAQIGAFLTGLTIKGETNDEIVAAVKTLREKSIRVPTKAAEVVDTCGTGGDGMGTFNVSTCSAMVAAGAGASVAKHGNRAVSSACGSANVLGALGVELDLSPEQVGECIDECRIGFLFAPHLHPAMKHVIGPRREIGQRTLFNLMGPMINPARAKRQLIGVYDLNLTRTVAEVLGELGSTHVLVVAGTDGLDEITLTAPTRIAELQNGKVQEFVLNPEDLGFSPCSVDALKGGDEAANAQTLREILDGRKGPKRDIVVLNAGAAIYVAGLAADLKEGVSLAKKSIDTGAAAETLRCWVEKSQSF